MQPAVWGAVPVKSTVRRSPSRTAVQAISKRLGRDPVALHPVGEGVPPRRKPGDRRARERLGIVEQSGHVRVERIEPVALRQGQHPPLAGADGRQLRGEVASALLRRPRVAADELEQRLVQPASLHELERWDDDALLEEFGGEAGATPAPCRRCPRGDLGSRRSPPADRRRRTQAP